MRPLSITSRLTLFFSTASAAVLLAIGHLVGTLVEAHFESQDFSELESKVQLVRHALGKARTASDLEAVHRELSTALVGHGGLAVAVMSSDGNTLFATREAAFPPAFLERRTPDSKTAPLQTLTWTTSERPYRGVLTTAETSIPARPAETVAVALDIEPHHEFMSMFHGQLWLAIVAAVALISAFSWVAARRGLAPVRSMAKVAKGVSVRRLDERLPAESVPSELTELALAFNEMFARLEDSFRRLSDFSSDLAHELRTPISNLMTQAQVALSKSRSATEYRDVLYSSLEEYERLARMITDMLFLAKADNGLIVASRERIDLASEVRDLFGFYEAFAEEQQVELVLTGNGHATGDRLMVRRALSNLLSNAIRHTPVQGAVRVAIAQDADGQTRLTVENPGPTIPPEHLPRLFDRFYRVDASRQKASDGAGLGLAITRSIIEAHRGTIAVSSEHATTRFEIVLAEPAPVRARREARGT